MIKVALKHFIYDACIDQFFSAIYKNFVLPKKKKEMTWLTHGHMYDKMSIAITPQIQQELYNVMVHGTTSDGKLMIRYDNNIYGRGPDGPVTKNRSRKIVSPEDIIGFR